MAHFPADPVSAEEFVESLLPRLLGPPALAAGAAGLRVRLGLALSGEGGGDWTLALCSGGLEVATGIDAPLTLAISVSDWRGALWEERGGALGAMLARSLGADGGLPSLEAPPRFDVAVVDKLAVLDATIRLLVTDDECGDWCLDLRLGQGPVARTPQVTVRASAADTEALAARQLEALPALMTGRIQVDGEMALLLQIQALLRQTRG